MNEKIFAYCERGLDPAFWAEPLNAVTNAAFIIAGLFCAQRLATAAPGQGVAALWALVLVILAIGTGSFLFHTFATPWAALADTLPILIFMLVYCGLALRWFLELSGRGVVLGLGIFIAGLVLAGQIRCDGGACLNGSIGYVPALIAMLVIGMAAHARANPAGRALLAAGGIFTISLTFRTMDRELCDLFAAGGMPIGSHFLWHILNGIVLFMLTGAAIADRDRKSPAVRPA